VTASIPDAGAQKALEDGSHGTLMEAGVKEGVKDIHIHK